MKKTKTNLVNVRSAFSELRQALSAEKVKNIPEPLMKKCVQLGLYAFASVLVGLLVGWYSSNWKAFAYGFACAITLAIAEINHLYLFSRQEYVKVKGRILPPETTPCAKTQATVEFESGEKVDFKFSSRIPENDNGYYFYFGKDKQSESPKYSVLYSVVPVE